MIQSGFFNSVNGDRRYDASFFAKFFGTLIGNGVFPNPSTGLQVYESSNMTVTVKPGKGWINGYFIISDSDYNLTLDTADGVLNRIDRIVMGLDFASREIQIAVKKGTFASSPVAPTLQRDADAYELALADIYVGKGVTAITQANITDQRLNSTVCGIVKGLITEVDTSTIFNQYQSWFNQMKSGTEDEIEAWQAQQEQEFNTWFESIKNILDGDVAANLASRITTLEQELNEHKTELASQESGKGASLIGINDSGNKFASTTVEGALGELFQFANDGKTNIANVVGSPTLSSDTFTKISNDIQTQKNNLATNLSNKGQTSSGTETLKSLVDKVANVNTGKKWATGTATYNSSNYTFAVTGLQFVPSVVFYIGVTYPQIKGFGTNGNYTDGTAFGFRGQSTSSDTGAISFNQTGFIVTPYSTLGGIFKWIAFE